MKVAETNLKTAVAAFEAGGKDLTKANEDLNAKHAAMVAATQALTQDLAAPAQTPAPAPANGGIRHAFRQGLGH